MNLLEPWILLRLVAGVVACSLFARAAIVAQRVLRAFDAVRATEGQLALERQLELASTFVRVGAIVQVGTLAVTALAADHLSRGVRGAMCAYGVLSANEWGFRSLAVTAIVALTAGVVVQLQAFDAGVRTLDLARSLAALMMLMAPLGMVDLAFAWQFLTRLDLTAVASCCSTQLDAAVASNASFSTVSREITTALALAGTVAAIVAAFGAARTPTRRRVASAGLASLVALPFALGASALEVAPHAFEVPQHVCPFCLLRGDVYGFGYVLFGALYLGATWAMGAGLAAVLARTTPSLEALTAFARRRMVLGAAAWLVALVVAAAPVARFAVVSGGSSLFEAR